MARARAERERGGDKLHEERGGRMVRRSIDGKGLARTGEPLSLDQARLNSAMI